VTWLRVHAWDALIALTEIADGVGCLATLTLYRPSLAHNLRLRRIFETTRRLEGWSD
jgi:hypothetical protein